MNNHRKKKLLMRGRIYKERTKSCTRRKHRVRTKIAFNVELRKRDTNINFTHCYFSCNYTTSNNHSCFMYRYTLVRTHKIMYRLNLKSEFCSYTTWMRFSFQKQPVHIRIIALRIFDEEKKWQQLLEHMFHNNQTHIIHIIFYSLFCLYFHDCMSWWWWIDFYYYYYIQTDVFEYMVRQIIKQRINVRRRAGRRHTWKGGKASPLDLIKFLSFMFMSIKVYTFSYCYYLLLHTWTGHSMKLFLETSHISCWKNVFSCLCMLKGT